MLTTELRSLFHHTNHLTNIVADTILHADEQIKEER